MSGDRDAWLEEKRNQIITKARMPMMKQAAEKNEQNERYHSLRSHRPPAVVHFLVSLHFPLVSAVF